MSGCRYKAFGGIWIRADYEPELRATMAAIRAEVGWKPDGEVKWSKATGPVCHPAYLKIVDAFFAMKCRFNALVIDSYNMGRNRGEDPEQDYYRDLHWLIRRRVSPNATYRVVLDQRNNRERNSLGDLKAVLNHSARKDFGISRDIFAEVIARDSKKDCLVQLADVLVGAVCYHMNGKHCFERASPSKIALAAYIAEKGLFSRNVIMRTASGKLKFNVWLWTPR